MSDLTEKLSQAKDKLPAPRAKAEDARGALRQKIEGLLAIDGKPSPAPVPKSVPAPAPASTLPVPGDEAPGPLPIPASRVMPGNRAARRSPAREG